MDTGASGQEFSLEDQDSWRVVSVTEGQIIEVNLPSSSVACSEETWAACFVIESVLLPDSSLAILCRFLGCEDDAIATELARHFNPGPRRIHLCLSRPCLDLSDDEKLHATRIRVWSVGDFSQGQLYVKDSMMKMIPGWRKLLKPGQALGEKPAEVKDVRKPPASRRRVDPTPKGSGAPKDVAKPRRKRETKPKEPKDGAGGDDKAMTEAKKIELRARLRRARSDLLKDGDPSFPISDGEDCQSVGSSAEDSDSGQGSLTGSKTKKKKEKKDKKKKPSSKKERKDRSAGLTPGTLLTRLKTPLAIGDLGVEQKELEDQNESTSKSWRTQLALKAVEQAGLGKKKKKKKKSKSSTEKVSKLLARLLTSKEDRSSKKKKKKRKRTLTNGVIESYSTSSSSSSEESIEEKSDEELEAPLRRKSKERPGSVLALLTSHVAQQLDQGSMVDMDGEDQGVVSGVKVMTYFNLFLKPNHLNHQRELRELHSLAAMIDILRQGDLAKVGDALAGRFIALHQFLQDGTWNTARHMELYPMDTGHAASSSVILASRKHARLVQKVQGLNPGGQWVLPYGRGKGKGKYDWQGFENPGKGKEKGKKGKGKGKWQPWNLDSKGRENEWEKNKEKPEEKK